MKHKTEKAIDWLTGTVMVFLWSGFIGFCAGVGFGLAKGKGK